MRLLISSLWMEACGLMVALAFMALAVLIDEPLAMVFAGLFLGGAIVAFAQGFWLYRCERKMEESFRRTDAKVAELKRQFETQAEEFAARIRAEN